MTAEKRERKTTDCNDGSKPAPSGPSENPIATIGAHRAPLQKSVKLMDGRSRNLKSGCVKQRLRRLDRLYLRSPVHFVTACTATRRHILSNPDVHRAFTKFGERGSEHGAWIGRY